MRTILSFAIVAVISTLVVGTSETLAKRQTQEAPSPLSERGQRLEKQYSAQLNQLRAELSSALPTKANANAETLNLFLSTGDLDDKLVTFVVLAEATPRGLAAYAQQGASQQALVRNMLNDTTFMKQMLMADGPSAPRVRRGLGVPQYGAALEIYDDIQAVRQRTDHNILDHLALAVSLEHATPITQVNPVAKTDASHTVDPVKRFQHYEQAFLDGELDPAFAQLTPWELRMVVNGDEPEETLAWGRKMLRNFRPDHITNPNFGWRYVSIVGSDVKYGSENVKHDRPDLQKYQNILMNGGVCGRRAFFGRFILRSFGVPTIARPSRGHGALAHWTPDGWVVNLGGGWGSGWTKTRYKNDVDFLATTQARGNADAFMKVKRAQWAGDVMGEQRTYGETEENPEFWNRISLETQRAIIEQAKAVTLDALGEDLGEANESTTADNIIASPVTADDKKITTNRAGVINLPAAAYSKPKGNTREVLALNSFGGGLQVYLPRFFPQGKTIMRGGTWKGDANACNSGNRMLSGGYGRYENWGLRAAISANPGEDPKDLNLDLGNGVTMELVYIPPGTFEMGGERKTDGRFDCVEVPQHEVTLTQGFYLGKHEVTQAQYEAIMAANPSRSTKSPDCPVDNVSEADALTFCGKLAEQTGRDVRLPTEAEWEYASRGGTGTKWFFGEDPARLADYAWFKGNAGGKSHPVGQKQPNPFGLYDIYGNVCERISDKYARNYYAISPKIDPTGPSQGTKSRMEYEFDAPRGGDYALTANVVTSNDDQKLNLAVNDEPTPVNLVLPFTTGDWQDSSSVTLTLKKGKNVLRIWRDQPPQYGIGIKEFTLSPMK